jgi:hypothetical protein
MMAEDILKSYAIFLDSVKRNLPKVELELVQDSAYCSYFGVSPIPKTRVLIRYNNKVDLEKKAKGLLELSGEVEITMATKTLKILSINMPLDLESLVKIANDKDIIAIDKSRELEVLETN